MVFAHLVEKAALMKGIEEAKTHALVEACPCHDIAQPEHLYDLVIEGLPSDFPPLRTAL